MPLTLEWGFPAAEGRRSQQMRPLIVGDTVVVQPEAGPHPLSHAPAESSAMPSPSAPPPWAGSDRNSRCPFDR